MANREVLAKVVLALYFLPAHEKAARADAFLDEGFRESPSFGASRDFGAGMSLVEAFKAGDVEGVVKIGQDQHDS